VNAVMKLVSVVMAVTEVNHETNSVTSEICGFHCGEGSSRGLLGCDAVNFCGRIPTFQRSMLPPLPP